MICLKWYAGRNYIGRCVGLISAVCCQDHLNGDPTTNGNNLSNLACLHKGCHGTKTGLAERLVRAGAPTDADQKAHELVAARHGSLESIKDLTIQCCKAVSMKALR